MTAALTVEVQTAIALPPELEVIAPAQWQEWFNLWFDQAPAVFTLPAAEQYSLTLRLCDDGEIQHLNAQYRQRDQPTDVLAFATLDAPQPAIALPEVELGDILVSIETAARQAQGHSLTQEVVWLVSHGFLHLLGWDHPDEQQRQQMLTQQHQLLTQVQIPPPWSAEKLG